MTISRWHKPLFMAVLALCLACEAHAADIALAPQAASSGVPGLSSAFRTVRLNGPIESGDAERLRRLLDENLVPNATPKGALVIAELNSEAGDYAEAMKLGEILKEYHVTTVVRRNDACLSGCILAFLGGTSTQSLPDAHVPGRYMEIGARVSFKNYYGGAHSASPGASEFPVKAILEYSEQMGVERGFAALLRAYDVGQPIFIDTVEGFQDLRACPIGLGQPTISLAEQAANLCNQSTGRYDPDAGLTTTAMMDAEFRLQLLDYAEKNIWWLGVVDTKSKLADRLHSGAFRKNDNVAARLYADLKAAGIPLPGVTGANFQVHGYNAGPYQMRCYASISPADADKFELVFLAQPGVTRSTGVTEAARAAPTQCRGLLRRNNGEIINPQPH